MVADLLPERELRGPGCSTACRTVQAFVPGQFGRATLLLHDTATHEAYGATLQDVDRIATGPLVVDLARCLVLLDGLPVPLTPTEYWIVVALARHLDSCVSHATLGRAVWGAGSDGLAAENAQMLRVNVARVRRKIGRAAGLIVTQLGLGYRLLRVEPDAVVPPYQPLTGAIHDDRWSCRYANCRNCGTTERTHHGRGYCAPCYRRLVRGNWRAS
jgi:DNA-binding winged helix-turn-helix (wHTH) protein